MPARRRQRSRVPVALATALAAASVAVPAVAQPTADVPDPALLIHEVQGSGSSSPVAGQNVVVEGIVTSLFETNDVLSGFFMQEEDADADGDPATSEAVFVHCGSVCPAVGVQDQVGVTGSVNEFFGMTQISVASGGDVVVGGSGLPLPTAVPVGLPAPASTSDEETFEAVEGMVATFPDTLVVSEYFQLARYGQIVLTETSRPYQFTHVSEPDVAAYQAFLGELERRRIILDDNNSAQNDATVGPAADEPYAYPSDPWPSGGLSTSAPLRGGETITDLTGVMHWSFGQWRVRPIDGVAYTFTETAPREPSPEGVGSDFTVASFNVLNYFTTLDLSDNDCGPSRVGCRGADSTAEFERQQGKIVSALASMDADVVGLVEIENDATSVQNLVDALNAKMGDGAYAQVETGPIGTDAIKVAFIYQPASVAPTGDFAVLDSAVDPAFLDTKNRPVLIQTFTEAAGGERFTAAVAHLKSKGSSCDDVGDPNMGDGQGSCPGTRTAATRTLANYLETDPTGSGDPDYLVLGDLNSYRNEDPIVALEDAGYSDLLETEVGDDAYTFVFDGQLGYLDHAMANASLSRQVSGVTAWHINADEVPLLDYNDPVQDPNEQSFERKSSALPLFLPDAFRSSDHDPVVVGLDLGPVDRPATPVTPGSPPAPAGPTCDADGVLVPPAAQAGVVWTVDPADSTGPGTYGVTAAPAEGYTFPSGAQTTWEIIVGARLTEGCTPPVPPLVTPPVTPPVVTPPVDADKAVAVRVRAVAGGKKLYVNVNPNKGRGYWQFTVQKLVNGKWRTQSKVYKTSGKYETRRLRLAKGTYRVVVLPRYGYAGATSEVVSLRSAPAAVVHPDRGVAASVKVRAVSGKSKLHVNVNPNKGRGYWQFAVQKYTKGKWRALPKVYKTTKRIETRRLNLERGKYRVVVMSRYGYDGVVSDTVRLRR